MKKPPYLPHDVFPSEAGRPRVMIAPARYIQGERTLDHLGRYLSLVAAKYVVVLMSSGGQRRIGERVRLFKIGSTNSHSALLGV